MLKRTEMIFHNGYKRVVFLLCFFARVPAWQNIGEMIFLTHQGRRTFLHCEWADLSSLLRISKSFLTGSAGEGFLYCIIMLVTSQIQQYGKWFPTKTSQQYSFSPERVKVFVLAQVWRMTNWFATYVTRERLLSSNVCSEDKKSQTKWQSTITVYWFPYRLNALVILHHVNRTRRLQCL